MSQTQANIINVDSEKNPKKTRRVHGISKRMVCVRCATPFLFVSFFFFTFPLFVLSLSNHTQLHTYAWIMYDTHYAAVCRLRSYKSTKCDQFEWTARPTTASNWTVMLNTNDSVTDSYKKIQIDTIPLFHYMTTAVRQWVFWLLAKRWCKCSHA